MDIRKHIEERGRQELILKMLKEELDISLVSKVTGTCTPDLCTPRGARSANSAKEVRWATCSWHAWHLL